MSPSLRYNNRMDFLPTQAKTLLGLQLTPRQVEAFSLYEKELLEWNEKFNLTAIRKPEEIRSKHFLDSLTCMQGFKEPRPVKVIDIGTGAGFPGIPLKIIFPQLRLTLVESVGKKADFCRHMIEVLHLDKVEVLQARAEDLGQLNAHRESYDLAVARAVAALPVLAEYLLPLVKVGGRMIAQKGESAPAEVHAAEHAVQILGGRVQQITPVVLPGVADERFLVIIDKVAATPKPYPRRAGLPSKRPL
ncbi:16S rRNA (guanine(527)-N(7))-methyltransferase RsmG [Leptolinea tardivitalis]|nr:16S rRNA (guanine(527)-N(7))-methyltransferase RsmG [Leptolinea tardivitalis]GAP21730.1 16S rRNA m(7)G-527 methyltransferase [Leptolinea tardivitalis]